MRGVYPGLGGAIDELRSACAADPEALRGRALYLVRQYTESDNALYYQLADVDGEPRPTRTQFLGLSECMIGRINREGIVWPAYANPAQPVRDWNRRVVLMPQVLGNRHESFQDTPMYRRGWRPERLHDQLRMVVYHRGAFVAWIGAFRRDGEPTYSRADQRRLAPLADALADALIHADGVERTERPEGDCDLILRPDGTIEYACQALRGWPAGSFPRERLQRWVREAESSEGPPTLLVSGLRARWKRLLGEGPVRYLVHLEPVRPWRLNGAALLSSAQRRVAELIAAGVTVAEAGAMLGISENTVKTHLKRVYQELGIENRAELVAQLHRKSASPEQGRRKARAT